jgi:Putative transposase
VKVTDGEIQFWRKDLKQKRRALTRYSIEGFVATLAEHVPDRYRQGMRYFGLLAARTKAQICCPVYASGQVKRPRPRRLSWANSLRKNFPVDPLASSGPFYQAGNPDQNHRTNKCHNDGTDQATARPDSQEPEIRSFAALCFVMVDVSYLKSLFTVG